MSTKLRAVLINNSGEVPAEFNEYQFCKTFHCMPKDIDEMPAYLYSTYIEFMRQEAEAGKIRSKQQELYSK